jgi:RNA polymerase sigma-70 factor (ECF subfamily)
MRDLTFTELERLETAAEADEAFHMDEETFRAFYERTSRPVWAYLSRLTGDTQLADDLLQEAYYRFLRIDRVFSSDAHRRNYLFRIATNLVRDGQRRHRVQFVPVPDDQAAEGDVAERGALRTDLKRAMGRLTPRERELLWLAYAQGSSHDEIAETLGLKTGSIKLLLFRARRRLAQFLGGLGEVTGPRPSAETSGPKRRRDAAKPQGSL